MGTKQFDRKFGADLLRELPAQPAVYLFKAEDGTVLYAGKAKNIRRRLQSYRNATRRKAHRKMRTLVRQSSALEVRLQPSERQALLVENQLIRELAPRYNVDGAFHFLYPAIGTRVREHDTLFCFTTKTDVFADQGLRWHGTFRSRQRARAAFDALAALLDHVGHTEPRARLRGLPRPRGSCCVAVRRVESLVPGLDRFFAGESDAVLGVLAGRLLEKPDARVDAASVETHLRELDAFFRSDARPLRDALRSAGRPAGFVSQQERDALFIAHRHPGTAPDGEAG
ncbi:MAG: nucleotide excision repair endonuclease [Myxococcota bacterium]